jgi:hypothetical protein
MENTEKEIVAIVPNKETLTLECYYEDGTTAKFKFERGDRDITWEEMLEPLECLIVSKH